MDTRPRPHREFVVGDQVAFWRKGKGSGAKPGARARWFGPAVVVGTETGNLWLAFGGMMIKAAPEQLRFASSTELLTHQALSQVLADYQEPPIDPAKKEALMEYVAKRKQELPDAWY